METKEPTVSRISINYRAVRSPSPHLTLKNGISQNIARQKMSNVAVKPSPDKIALLFFHLGKHVLKIYFYNLLIFIIILNDE